MQAPSRLQNAATTVSKIMFFGAARPGVALLLPLIVALGGCATQPHLRSSAEYRVPLTNGFVACLQNKGGTLEVIVKRGDDFTTTLRTDGESVQFVQNLDVRPDKTNQEKDSGFGSVIYIVTDKGKLSRHAVEIFDGKTQQCLYDRDKDFFFDERVSIEVDREFNAVAGSRRRELIRHQFVPKEATDSK